MSMMPVSPEGGVVMRIFRKKSNWLFKLVTPSKIIIALKKQRSLQPKFL